MFISFTIWINYYEYYAKHMKKVVIFDFNRTLYDPETGSFFPGAIQTLEKLKKKGAVLILLGKGTDERMNLINELGLHRYFDEIIVREEKELGDYEYLKKKHPKAKFYSIGDRLRKEIKYSNICGFKTIRFKQGKFSTEKPDCPEEKPWKTIMSFDKFLPLLGN